MDGGNIYSQLAQSPAPDFGPGNLGRMAGICYSHQATNLITIVPAPRIPTFQKGWEACEKVYAAWLDSETARKQRERAELEERQRLEVIDFVSKLAR